MQVLPAAAKFTAKEGECDFTFTEEDLGGDPKQIIRKDGYYEANILFNLSLSNSVKMSVGDTFDLVAMRTWQTVDTVINNYFFEPDFTYTVHGDSITVSDDGVITAVKDGTSFVTVAYNAFRSNGHLYSAIFPENTGVFAVTVGDGFAESPITTIPSSARYSTLKTTVRRSTHSLSPRKRQKRRFSPFSEA